MGKAGGVGPEGVLGAKDFNHANDGAKKAQEGSGAGDGGQG